MVPYLQATLLCLACFQVAGQKTRLHVPPIVEAEEAFALMAKEKNSRDAFLHFLADDAITASQGHGPRTGKDHLHKQPIDSSLLSWYPVYTCVAASGDFGYNTGPWEFRKSKHDDEPIAWGQFVSMWESEPKGEWRVSLDMGIYHGKPAENKNSVAVMTELKKPRKRQTADFQSLERDFINRLGTGQTAAYRSVTSSETRFFRPGIEPLLGTQPIEEFLKNADQIQYELIGGDIASSGDMAYVYGSAKVQKAIGKDTSTHSYLRIWQKEDGKWQLALDLLTP